MRTINMFLLGSLILLASCKNEQTEEHFYVENKPSFFDLRNQNWLTNKWIRKSENLLWVHATFKKFGYQNLLSNQLLSDNPLIIQDIYIKRRGNDLLDSLEKSYNNQKIQTIYYREFWNRRKLEGNDEVVYQIIKDINSELKGKRFSPNNENEIVNDTLLSLLNIEFKKQELDDDIALKNFEYLKKIGMHQSAYNLLYEHHEYDNIQWNQDSLKSTLKPTKDFTYPWLVDNSK